MTAPGGFLAALNGGPMRIKLIIAVLFALLAATTLAQTTGVAPIEDSVLGAWVKAHGVYAFAGASLAGVLCNYASMRYNDLTSVTLLEYLFKHQPGRSVASAFVIAGSIWAAA